MSIVLSRKTLVALAATVAAGVAAIAAFAALPSRTVQPGSVPLGTLSGQTDA